MTVTETQTLDSLLAQWALMAPLECEVSIDSGSRDGYMIAYEPEAHLDSGFMRVESLDTASILDLSTVLGAVTYHSIRRDLDAMLVFGFNADGGTQAIAMVGAHAIENDDAQPVPERFAPHDGHAGLRALATATLAAYLNAITPHE